MIKNQLPQNWRILQKRFEKNLKGVSLFNLNYFIIYHNYLILHQNTFHSVTWSNFLNYIFIVQFQLCVYIYMYVCMYVCIWIHIIFLLICTSHVHSTCSHNRSIFFGEIEIWHSFFEKKVTVFGTIRTMHSKA